MLSWNWGESWSMTFSLSFQTKSLTCILFTENMKVWRRLCLSQWQSFPFFFFCFLFFFLGRLSPAGRPPPPPLRPALCQVTAYLAMHTRAPAKYVTALAPLLARWLKRRRKEHGKTCERSEDFSERQLLFSYGVFWTPHMHKPPCCAQKGITFERNVTALLQITVFWLLSSTG